MSYYWVKKPDGKCGCVVGDEQAALRHGAILGTLPYPASPVLARNGNDCPPFCWMPDGCLNQNTCHGQFKHGRACDD